MQVKQGTKHSGRKQVPDTSKHKYTLFFQRNYQIYQGLSNQRYVESPKLHGLSFYTYIVY